MKNKLCLDMRTLLILLILVIIILINNNNKYQGYNNKLKNKLSEIKYEKQDNNKVSDDNYSFDNTTIRVASKQDLKDNVYNPLEEPNRKYVLPVNVRTRGELPNFQKVGILKKKLTNTDDTKSSTITDNDILPLYGRPKYPGSNDYEYYIMDGSRNANKVALDVKKRQLDNNDQLLVPGFNGTYKVTLYTYDAPRYIPF